MWFQSLHAQNKDLGLQKILRSEYCSEDLKQKVRKELGYVTPPSKNVTPIEWFAMMYGVFRAMPDEEKQSLHDWEREYVDGSGDFATSDWPGWEKYIGQFPNPARKSERRKKRGFIYLVYAETGEYKIGYSIDVKNRIKVFSVQPPFEYKLIHSFPTDDMVQAEALLHEKFSEKNIKGEWFRLDVEEVSDILLLVGFEDGRFIL
jgi:Meiotically up-regulated gene 113